ncbi:MAG TPA: cell division protein FtsL [Gammaproteobacteria bacterium]|nr:cell division protein FtsL [Gammaproteobacteria bacterium]
MSGRMQNLLLAALLLAVIGSSLGLVWVKYDNRMLFSRSQRLEKQRDRLDVQWGRLELERGTLVTRGRIQQLAHDKLGMHMPRPKNVVIVR